MFTGFADDPVEYRRRIPSFENVPEKVLDKIRAQIPLGRLCRPEEISRVVHFLAADESAYITGQVWGVNGGLDM